MLFRKNNRSLKYYGFTIVELLVVVVIIGILASFVFVSYSNITKKAVAANLKSDLRNSLTKLGLYNVTNGVYPQDLETALANDALVKGEGTDYQYTFTEGNYCLSATSANAGSYSYHLSSQVGTIEDGVCSGHASAAALATTWKQIDVGYEHTCAIGFDDLAYCWGSNDDGQLGISRVTSYVHSPTVIETRNTGLSGKTIKSISTGYYNTCAIASDDNAYCWGSYYSGQLGNNSTSGTDIATVYQTGVLAGKTIKTISVGKSYVCAIASDDQVYCWGENGNGQLGNNSKVDSIAPVAVDTTGVLSGKTAKSISTSDYGSCVIASDDQVYCWGGNNGSTLPSGLVPSAIDMTGVLNGKTIKTISSEGSDTCVVASDDRIYCWGENNFGQLGNGSVVYSKVPVAVDVAGLLNGKNIKSVTVANYHTCAIAYDDMAYCWGRNSNGQLGDGLNVNSLVPMAVKTAGVFSNKTFKGLVAGGGTTCAVASNDKVYCWGNNYYGQLGKGTSSNDFYPSALYTSGSPLDGKTIKAVSVGYLFTCVIASDDWVYCWGNNDDGQLGNNSFVNSSLPVAVYKLGVLNGKTIKSISAGYYHVCAIASDDKAYCWGDGSYVGINYSGDKKIPVAVDTTGELNGLKIKSISSGGRSTCAIASNNRAYCWGNNTYGQLGINSNINSYVPVAVNNTGVLSGLIIKAISMGFGHVCVIASDDRLYCWGYNSDGQIGNNSTVNSLIPANVDMSGVLNGFTAKSVSAGGGATCTVASNEKVYCWGSGSQIGGLPYGDKLVPIATFTNVTLDGKTVLQLIAGGRTCMLASDGKEYCLGNTNVDINPAYVPLSDLYGKTIKGISESCSIDSEDKIYCWGQSAGYKDLSLDRIPSTPALNLAL